MERLFAARVAVFGIGGVGGHCVDALVRSGVGTLALFDDDKICLTNLNRQLIATHKTVGLYKVDVMREHILAINPQAQVEARRLFFMPETAAEVDFSAYDYIVDAIDTVTAKVELICRAHAVGTPLISSMGAANKLDATAFRVTDIYRTHTDPLARVLRKILREREIPALKVVCSEEKPGTPVADMALSCRENCICPPGTRKCTVRRQIPASNAFVPSVCGLIIAGEVIKDLIQCES
jgi:tRNA A37 threonylcarbamoyladenosine dehydratase